MFEINREYNRQRDIHDQFGGQRQGGISTPANHPAIFIFISHTGLQHGYIDDYDEDGVFRYTEEGQAGDMQMKAGNRAIRDHKQENKNIYVFEQTRSGYVIHLGTAEYITHSIETRPDRDGGLRNAYVFHLDINTVSSTQAHNVAEAHANYTPANIHLRHSSLQQLRQTALSKPVTSGETTQRIVSVRYRSQALKWYVLKRANGACESCNQPAPFQAKWGPFLECHHVYRLADGGPDAPENVIALCPNCHRRAHYSSDKQLFNQTLQNKALEIESST